MAGIEIPVLIVGGGPAGLTSSIVLSRLGVPSLLVERHPGTLNHPKAIAIMQRTAELFRLWGAEQRMRQDGVPEAWYGQMIWTTTLAGEELGRTVTVEPDDVAAEPKSPTRAFRCPQNITEAALLACARRYGCAQLLFNTQMTGFAQDAAGITATILDRGSGEQRTVRAQYLIAADGTASGIRASCGIAQSGDADIGHFINIFHRAALGPLVRDRPAWSYSVATPELFGAFVTVNGDDLWLFHLDLGPDETPEDYPAVRCIEIIRHAAGLSDLPVEIISVKPWIMGAQISDRFRAGHVLLTGDAAHRTTPDGGVGMNTAIQSAHNLAWKVGAVVAGWAREALLDSYETERRPAAQMNVAYSRRRGGGLMAMVEAIKAGDLDAVRAGIRARSAAGSRQGQDLGYTYEAGALVPDGTALPQVEDRMRDYVPNARPGSRAPHLWLARHGERISSLDLFDAELVLLTGVSGQAWLSAAQDVARSRRVLLQAYTIGARGDLVAPDARWRELYGIEPDGAVLVRPDGFVGWRARSAGATSRTELDEAVATVTGAGTNVASSGPGDQYNGATQDPRRIAG